MRKLLRADFARLWRDKIFWLALTAMAAAGQFCFWARFQSFREGYAAPLEDPFMVYVPVAAIVLSALCALFIGVDYSDGTIRNKLIAGHGRASVYSAANAASVPVPSSAQTSIGFRPQPKKPYVGMPGAR